VSDDQGRVAAKTITVDDDDLKPPSRLRLACDRFTARNEFAREANDTFKKDEQLETQALGKERP
jgi:hypothetical protein